MLTITEFVAPFALHARRTYFHRVQIAKRAARHVSRRFRRPLDISNRRTHESHSIMSNYTQSQQPAEITRDKNWRSRMPAASVYSRIYGADSQAIADSIERDANFQAASGPSIACSHNPGIDQPSILHSSRQIFDPR